MGYLINTHKSFAAAITTVSDSANAQSDNAEEFNFNGQSFVTSTDLELNSDDTNGNQWAASIFKGLNIPSGATITEASVQFIVKQVTLGDAPITIYGHLGNKTSFGAIQFQISSLSATTASVGWDIPDWANINDSGVNQLTPDLTTIIQEIVDRVGYNSSDSITIIYDSDEVNTTVKYSYNANSDSSKCPVLTVNYETPF
tara:strand:- start:6901 stop:7500 length:600 start_codon:yes stop_codon:yes gene_type:complete